MAEPRTGSSGRLGFMGKKEVSNLSGLMSHGLEMTHTVLPGAGRQQAMVETEEPQWAGWLRALQHARRCPAGRCVPAK